MNNNFNQTPFLQSGNPALEHRLPDSYSKGQLGQRFTFDDPTDQNAGKRWQLVDRDSHDTGVITAGQVVYWNGIYGYTITTSISAALGRGGVAGIAQCAIAAGEVGCIQLGGPSLVTFTSGTPTAAGLFAIPSATEGTADAIAAGGAATYPPIGLTRSTATNNQATVELQLPGRE